MKKNIFFKQNKFFLIVGLLLIFILVVFFAYKFSTIRDFFNYKSTSIATSTSLNTPKIADLEIDKIDSSKLTQQELTIAFEKIANSVNDQKYNVFKKNNFYKDFGNLLCDTLHKKCNFIELDKNQLFDTLDKKEADLIIGDIPFLEKLSDMYLLSDPFLKSKYFFISRDTCLLDLTSNSIEGRNIYVKDNTVRYDFIEKHYKQYGAHIVPLHKTEDFISNYQKDSSGLFFIDANFALYYVNALPNFDFNVFLHYPNFEECSESFDKVIMRQEDKELLRFVNLAIRNIKLSDSYQSLCLKYFPYVSF